MAPPPKDVLFGPIKDWGKGYSKALLEFDGEGGVKIRRQYVLENVANWITIEKEYRAEEETLRVVDGPSAEKAIEILNKVVVIQDSIVNRELDSFDFKYNRAEKEDKILDSITVRPKRLDSRMVEAMIYEWVFSTPKSKLRRMEPDTVKEQLERLETKIEDTEEKDSKVQKVKSINSIKKRKNLKTRSLKKEKKKVLGQVVIRQLKEELKVGLVVLAVPRPFQEMEWAEDLSSSDKEEEAKELMERLIEGQEAIVDGDEEMKEEEVIVEVKGDSIISDKSRTELEVAQVIRRNTITIKEVGELKYE
ncbi:hypothetical protein EV426DRAFT_722089 [Tirmania nivea]|nr:hypothetical protein EV426DRAFT_722089 [Tirmania nivea]